MALFDLTSNLLHQAALGSAAREAALANNIANANTPGYRRVDVDFHAAMQKALDSGRFTADGDISFTPTPDEGGPVRADGGNVDPDIEMSELAENSLEYQALMSIQKTRLHILGAAIGAS